MPSAYMEFNGYACLAPGEVTAEMDRLRVAGAFIPDDWEGYANSFCDVRGVDPSYAYLIVPSDAVTQVSSAASTGLKITMKFGDIRHWTKLKVESAKKVGPAANDEQSYYFIKAVDQRYVLAGSFVGSRFNLVTGYTPPPPGSSSSVKGSFSYDPETIPNPLVNTPFTWQQLFNLVWNVPDTTLDQTAVSAHYPAYLPQDLDWRYTTNRDALQELLHWCNFTVEPNPLGTFKLVRCKNNENALFGALATFSNVVVNNRFPRHREPGEPAVKFNLHFETIDPPNSAVKEYSVLQRVPSSFNTSKAMVDLRLPCVYVPDATQSTYPTDQWPPTVADTFLSRQSDYFNQFPATELTLAGFCYAPAGALSLIPGAFVEQITYFDLGEGAFTNIITIRKRQWTPQPTPLDNAGGESDSSFAIATVVSAVASTDPEFVATPESLIWGTLGPLVNGNFRVINSFGEALTPTQRIPVWSKKDSGVWRTDRTGSGSQVVRFELLEDKSLVDYAKLAVLIDNEGNTLDPEFNTIYVVDPNNRYMGYGPLEREEGADPEKGFQGTALFLLDDYFDGIPGYSIIEMESVARWNDGRLTSDFTRTTETTKGRCEVGFNFWGNAPNGKKPKTQKQTVSGGGSEIPDATYDTVEFTDPFKLVPEGTTLARGTRVGILFVETTETWILVHVGPKYVEKEFIVLDSSGHSLVTTPANQLKLILDATKLKVRIPQVVSEEDFKIELTVTGTDCPPPSGGGA